MNENSVNKAPQTSVPEFSLDDPTVIKALEITAQKGKWSTVLLQTYLGKNNIYMGNLAIWAEENHLIAPINGNKPRLIYFSSVSDAIDIINKTKTQSKSLSVEQLDNTKMLLSVNPSFSLNNQKYLEHLQQARQGEDFYCSPEIHLFIDTCIDILLDYYSFKYESEFKPPFQPYTFAQFEYEKIYKTFFEEKVSLYFFAYQNKLAFSNFELLDIYPVFTQLLDTKNLSTPKLKAWYFIKQLGPTKALDKIKQIINYDGKFKQKREANRISSLIDHRLATNHAHCADIETELFTWQFRYLTLVNFSNSDHEKIIKKISKFKTRQLARYAEQISLYFTNYIFQLDKLPPKKYF